MKTATFVSATVVYNFHWVSWCPSLRYLMGQLQTSNSCCMEGGSEFLLEYDVTLTQELTDI